MRVLPFKNLGWAAIAQAALVLGSSGAHAGTLPPRKPGFWQSTMVMQMSMNGKTLDSGQPTTSFICSDAQTEAAEIKKMTHGMGGCGAFNVTVSGNSYLIDGSCKDPMGSGTMVTHATITMESQTAYHTQSVTTSPHMSGSVNGDSKWLGACPAGVQPGDIGHMVNGQFVKMTNILAPSSPP